MTDIEGIQASVNPRLANPARHDHEKWVQARKAELRKQSRREVAAVAVFFAFLIACVVMVVMYAKEIDGNGMPYQQTEAKE